MVTEPRRVGAIACMAILHSCDLELSRRYCVTMARWAISGIATLPESCLRGGDLSVDIASALTGGLWIVYWD